VVSAVFGAFSGTFKVVNETEAQEEVYAAARVALERISEDLSSACDRDGLSEGKQRKKGMRTGGLFSWERTTRWMIRARIPFDSSPMPTSLSKGGHQVEGPAEINYYMQYREKTGDFPLPFRYPRLSGE
jgi:hypothetical protein